MVNDQKAQKMRFYDGLAGDWDHVMNRYDLQKRLSVVYEQLLPQPLAGLRLLDAGCGIGYFSEVAAIRGADVVLTDIGRQLVIQARRRCPSAASFCSSLTELGLQTDSVDVAVCSEVIEHTVDPNRVLTELYRVLRPDGVLALTVPNRFWKWSVLLANALHLRPYEGLENWQGYFGLQQQVRRTGFIIEDWFGFHLLPFQFRLFQYINQSTDSKGHLLGPCMINVAARLRKPKSPANT